MFMQIGKVVYIVGRLFRNFVAVVGGSNREDNNVYDMEVNADGHVQVEGAGHSAIPTYATLTVVNMPVANTEYTFVVPGIIKKLHIQARQNTVVRFSFAPNRAGPAVDPYATIKAGSSYTVDDITPVAGPTWYFASSRPNIDMEIIYWA